MEQFKQFYLKCFYKEMQDDTMKLFETEENKKVIAETKVFAG